MEQRWIPVAERLPEELTPVNITWINRSPEQYYADIKDVPFRPQVFFIVESGTGGR